MSVLWYNSGRWDRLSRVQRADSGHGDGESAMTHAELVQRAARWLRNTKRCGVVFTEKECYSTAREFPDAIGWRNFESYLVECKTSRSDFLADLKKLHRESPNIGMGDRRYYMTPPELVQPDEVPKHWGLLWVYPRIVRVKRGSWGLSRDRTALNERPLLVKALRDLQKQKVGEKAP